MTKHREHESPRERGEHGCGHDHDHERHDGRDREHDDSDSREGHGNDHGDHHHGHHHHGHHHHGHHHHHGSAGEGNKKALAIALSITSAIMLLEFFGGLWTNSLALLSDSGHMLSDAGALALSLFAVWLAAKPASPRRTYGYHRFEILAALFNAATLFVIAVFIVIEAYHRWSDPPTVASGAMMGIAVIGLAANLASAWTLTRKGDVKDNVNLRSAYLHVLGDALGSVGAIVAGLLMYFFGWYAADPLISVFVALLILRGAWGVMKHTLHVLMEGTPSGVDQAEVKRTLSGIPGVVDVHDLHIWTITSGLDSLSCHLLIEDGGDSQAVLQEAVSTVERRFRIAHATIQVETSQLVHADLKV